MGASMDVIKGTLMDLPRDIAYVGVALVLLVIATVAKDLMTPFKIREELTAKDNTAVGLSVAGYYIGVLLVCIGPLLTAPAAESRAHSAGYCVIPADATLPAAIARPQARDSNHGQPPIQITASRPTPWATNPSGVPKRST